MSAIAHLPGSIRVGTHRALALVLATVLLAAAVLVAVLLLTRETSTGAAPTDAGLPGYDPTCATAMAGSPC